MNLKNSSLTLIAITILLGGCANTKIANDELLDQKAQQMAIDTTLNPKDAITSATEKLQSAESQGLPFYAPLHFEEAQAALNKANKALKKGGANTEVLQEVFKLKSLLEAGYRNKVLVEKHLAKSLEHIKILDDLGIPNSLPRGYKRANKGLQHLVKDIEGGDIDKAVAGQEKLLKLMTEVEIEGLIEIHLTPVTDALDKAKTAGAKKFAESTFDEAIVALERAMDFIEDNHRNEEGVKNVAKEAMYAAQRAFHVSQEAETLVSIKPNEAEQRVLYYDSLFEKVRRPLGLDEIGAMSLQNQSETIANKVVALQKQAEQSVATINSGKAGEGETTSLSTKTANNQANNDSLH